MGKAGLIDEAIVPQASAGPPRRCFDGPSFSSCGDAQNKAYSPREEAMPRTKIDATKTRADGEEERSLEHMASRYSRALASFFSRRVTNKADVPDLVQDTFLRLAKLQSMEEVRRPDHYLFQTASSALRDRARRDAVRAQAFHLEYDEDQHRAAEISPERVTIGRFAVRELRDVVARLPDRTRDIFVLRAFEDMRSGEIAVAMGISQRAVEKHYAKALATVTAKMKARGHV